MITLHGEEKFAMGSTATVL